MEDTRTTIARLLDQAHRFNTASEAALARVGDRLFTTRSATGLVAAEVDRFAVVRAIRLTRQAVLRTDARLLGDEIVQVVAAARQHMTNEVFTAIAAEYHRH